MSAPRRTPPSIHTSTCPLTAFTTSGKARNEAGTLSSCRPPWFDTEIAAAQEVEDPAGMGQDVRQERQLLQQASAHQRLHAVAVVTLTDARDGRVDGDDERAEAGHPGALDGGL